MEISPTNLKEAAQVDRFDKVLGELLGPAFVNQMKGTFELVAIAEEEIARAKNEWPLYAHVIDSAFLIIQPNPIVTTGGGRLYRVFARELLERIPKDGSPRDTTDAEVIGSLKEFSFLTPLNETGFSLYWNTMCRAMPEIAKQVEGYAGEVHTYEDDHALVDDLNRGLRSSIARRVNRPKTWKKK